MSLLEEVLKSPNIYEMMDNDDKFGQTESNETMM